jgi:hypothetical protein
VDLRLTRRALSDLGLDLEACRGRSAWELVGQHEVIEAFVDLQHHPRAAQRLRPSPVTWARVTLLPAGEWFGLVWDDEENGVCWLLGALPRGLGEEGTRQLLHRDEVGALFPTEADYQDLEPTVDETHHFVVQAAAVGRQLIDSLRANPDQPRSVEIAGFHVEVSRDAVTLSDPLLDDIRITICSMSDAESEPPYPGWLLLLVAAILPEAQPTELSFQSDHPIVVIWRPSPSA